MAATLRNLRVGAVRFSGGLADPGERAVGIAGGPVMKQRHARHVGILLQLRSRPWVSASALAYRFGVDVRTIYLDIDLLSTAGVPIEPVPGRAGAYRLSRVGTATSGDDALDRHLLSARSREQLRRLGQRAYVRQQRLRLNRLSGGTLFSATTGQG